MRSTLPHIFKTHEKRNCSPKKQGGIFEIDLYMRDKSDSYKTKLINPHLNNDGVNHPKSFFRKRFINNRYDTEGRRSVSLSYEGRSVDFQSKNLQEIDNVKVNIRKVWREMSIVSADVNTFILDLNLLKNEMKGVGQRKAEQIRKMEEEMQEKVNGLWDLLSNLRRETGMEIKVNKKNVNLINEDLVQSCDIIKDIQGHRATIKTLNF